MNEETHDDNPWDDDDGARTIATAAPTFELPSNIPSPITIPPPPVAMPKNAAKSTLVGLMPDDVRASLANRAAPRPGGTRRPQPQPVSIPDDALDDLPPGQQDDGPTLTGAAASPNVPLRDDLAQPKSFAPAHRVNDADAETMALSFEDARLPNLDGDRVPDEAIRAGGDETTLAIGPERVIPDLGELASSLEPALAEALAQRVAEHHQQVQQAYPQQYQQAHQPPGPAPHFPQLQTQQQFAPPQPPQPQQFAQPASYTPPSNQWGAPQPAPWMQPPAPLARVEGGGQSLGGFRTSQVIVLAGVGVVCLAIFVVGLVLFFTTKF